VKSSLEMILSEDITENSERPLVDNVKMVMKILSEEYASGPKWILENSRLARREKECISIDWLDENVYCCIYPNEIAIAKATPTYNEEEFKVLTTESIRNEFKQRFESVTGLSQ
jgi:hypothetical protein